MIPAQGTSRERLLRQWQARSAWGKFAACISAIIGTTALMIAARRLESTSSDDTAILFAQLAESIEADSMVTVPEPKGRN